MIKAPCAKKRPSLTKYRSEIGSGIVHEVAELQGRRVGLSGAARFMGASPFEKV